MIGSGIGVVITAGVTPIRDNRIRDPVTIKVTRENMTEIDLSQTIGIVVEMVLASQEAVTITRVIVPSQMTEGDSSTKVPIITIKMATRTMEAGVIVEVEINTVEKTPEIALLTRGQIQEADLKGAQNFLQGIMAAANRTIAKRLEKARDTNVALQSTHVLISPNQRDAATSVVDKFLLGPARSHLKTLTMTQIAMFIIGIHPGNATFAP